MKQTYCRFNLYNSSRKRVSIFGQVQGEKLEIVVFSCSKDDGFSKKTAREIYANILETGADFTGKDYQFQEFSIPATNNPQGEFQDWCFSNYRTRVLKSEKKIQVYETISPAKARQRRDELWYEDYLIRLAREEVLIA